MAEVAKRASPETLAAIAGTVEASSGTHPIAAAATAPAKEASHENI
jgi:hypothetical protein